MTAGPDLRVDDQQARGDGPEAWRALGPARRRAGLSGAALYLRYVGLGGLATRAELAAHIASGAPLSRLEHDVAVLALNERFLERHDPQRLPYRVGDAPT
jgi:hypothetical protein